MNTSSATPLETLRYEIEKLQMQMHYAVAEERAAGRSWSQIGDQLGITKQAAQQRYGKSTTAVDAPAVQVPNQEVIFVEPEPKRRPKSAAGASAPQWETGVQFPGPVGFQIPEGEQDHADRIKCPCCMTSVGKDGKGKEIRLANFTADHAMQENGKCKTWNDREMTMPYYTPEAAPWATGWTTRK